MQMACVCVLLRATSTLRFIYSTSLNQRSFAPINFQLNQICCEWSTEIKSFTRHIRRKVPVRPVAQGGNRIKFRGHIWMEWFECRIRLMPFCCCFFLSLVQWFIGNRWIGTSTMNVWWLMAAVNHTRSILCNFGLVFCCCVRCYFVRL